MVEFSNKHRLGDIITMIHLQEASLSHFFAARKKEQLAGKNIQFGFTNVTRFELHLCLSIMKGLGRKVSGAFKKMTGGSSSRSQGGSSSHTSEPTPTQA